MQRSSSLIKQEVSDLVNIVLANYQVRVNEEPDVREKLKNHDQNLQELIKYIVSQQKYAAHLAPLERLLLTKGDSVAKQVVKSLQKSIYQYQVMMARSYSHNKIVQFSYYQSQTGQV